MKMFNYFVTITIMRRNVHLKMTVFMLMQIKKNANLEVIVKDLCVCLSMKIWLLRLVIVIMIMDGPPVVDGDISQPQLGAYCFPS